ncbi:hypothetical protein [Brevibacterium aurantiacum]|uniref:hypothetical protein n=1 Tax=Brevibacterium aurantiacum TaxID=273384 RepID=UPI0011C0689B|nr:hypothetical protein [Brevibacterium aurantiacum]
MTTPDGMGDQPPERDNGAHDEEARASRTPANGDPEHLAALLEEHRTAAQQAQYLQRYWEMEAFHRFTDQQSRRARVNTTVLVFATISLLAIGFVTLMTTLNPQIISGAESSVLVTAGSGLVAMIIASISLVTTFRSSSAQRRAESETTITLLDAQLREATTQLERTNREIEEIRARFSEASESPSPTTQSPSEDRTDHDV